MNTFQLIYLATYSSEVDANKQFHLFFVFALSSSDSQVQTNWHHWYVYRSQYIIFYYLLDILYVMHHQYLCIRLDLLNKYCVKSFVISIRFTFWLLVNIHPILKHFIVFPFDGTQYFKYWFLHFWSS